MGFVRVQEESFDTGALIDEIRGRDPRIGAVAAFVGLVRDLNEGRQVADMVLEHYPGMTERALQGIVDEARQRFDLVDVGVVHRFGRLAPLDPIVAVVVASAHRGEAFRACEFVMDFLKTRAPFWKKESTPQGDRWVDARDGDTDAAHRWEPRES
jgi:molybdopterin synthase catalytic subunit